MRFREVDLTGDTLISRNDFKQVLTRLNVADLYEETAMNGCINYVDMNNTNSISYASFIKDFYEYANQKMLKD